MPLQWEFDCPSCHTRFVMAAAPGVNWVSCPVCHIRLSVEQQAKPSALPIPAATPAALPTLQPTYSDEELLDEARPRKINWLLWGSVAFGALWLLITGIMLMVAMLN